MKLNGSGFDRFLRQPDEAVFAALIYGQDLGQVSERVLALKKTWLGGAADPFSETVLSAGQLATNQISLLDEMAAFSLTGGPRLVHLKHPAVEDVKAAVSVLCAFGGDHPFPVAKLIVEAGALAPSSSLRKNFDAAKTDAIALACYPDTPAERGRQCQQILSEAGHGIDPAALEILVASIPPDRRLLRMEIEKLVCYLADQPGQEVGPQHVTAIIAPAGESSLDDLVYACIDGQAKQADIALRRTLEAGQAPVMIVRAIARHLYRLHEVAAACKAGASAPAAVSKLRPPVFVMRRDHFLRQCQSWSLHRLDTTLEKALQTERELKSGLGNINGILGRFVLALSSVTH
ncbi:MAG: DNA polymerase III subunit delta [Robiginitomaculum sp.]|nr:MAG: DNA polymerase III subunit delta [Robiginitomaculum sp.]